MTDDAVSAIIEALDSGHSVHFSDRDTVSYVGTIEQTVRLQREAHDRILVSTQLVATDGSCAASPTTHETVNDADARSRVVSMLTARYWWTSIPPLQ